MTCQFRSGDPRLDAYDAERFPFEQATATQGYSGSGPNIIGSLGQAWASVMGVLAPSLAPEIFVADGATVTVGRVMSQGELDAMMATGRVQESFNNGVTSVTLPPNSGAYTAGPSGDMFVQFDVPQSAIGASDGITAKIYGPNSIFGPAKGITQMPSATNIIVPK